MLGNNLSTSNSNDLQIVIKRDFFFSDKKLKRERYSYFVIKEIWDKEIAHLFF